MMDAVRVVFCRRRNIGSILLRTWLWSAWSHCALIDGDEVIEAAAVHGVRTRPLADLIAASTLYEIVDIPVPDASAVIAAARGQIGQPYDYGGVAGIWFRRDWQDASRWFCSELVAWACSVSRPLFRGDVARITPRDLYIHIY